MDAPYTKDEGLAALTNAYYAAYLHLESADNDVSKAKYYLSIGWLPEWRTWLTGAVEDLVDFGYDAITRTWAVDEWYLLIEYLRWYSGETAEVDMNAILSAMWESETWQTLLFITRIDAMRGSVGEKTVTIESMAEQLKHFAE